MEHLDVLTGGMQHFEDFGVRQYLEQGRQIAHRQWIDDGTGVADRDLNEGQLWGVGIFTDELKVDGQPSFPLCLFTQMAQRF